jgi:integrase/recombinase XerC
MALQEPLERDFAVREYKTYLLTSGRSSTTVNAVLAALDNFHLYLGLGAAKVRRQDLPVQAPKALELDEIRRVKRSIARSSVRNQTVMLLMLHTGLRISELAALNVGDVFVTSRKGELLVRCGKGSKQRKIPLNSEARTIMQAYLVGPQDPQEPLFKSQRGARLSVNAIDYVVRQIARDAGVKMSAHTLRHCALSQMVRQGVDIVTVAELAGHSRLETTRRYSLPTANDKINAVEKLVDYAKT